MKRVTLAIVALVALMVTTAAFSYDYSDTGFYGPPESTKLLGSEPVPTEKQGKLCAVTINLGNNDSIRPGSDVSIVTGDALQFFPDTEAVKGDPPPVHAQMMMGVDISAYITFGPNINQNGEAEFSGKGTITVGECQDPPTTTTEPPINCQACGCPESPCDTLEVLPYGPGVPTPITASPKLTG